MAEIIETEVVDNIVEDPKDFDDLIGPDPFEEDFTGDDTIPPDDSITDEPENNSGEFGEDEEKTGEEEQPASKTGEEAPVLDADMLERAKQYGLKQEALDTIGSDHELARILTLFETNTPKPIEPKPEPIKPAEIPAVSRPAEPTEFKPIDKLNPGDFSDEQLAESFNAKIDGFNQTLQSMFQSIQSIKDQYETRAETDFQNNLDVEIGLVKSPDLFGEGSIFELPKDSPFRENRQKVYDQAVAILTGRQRLGQPTITMKSLVKQAVSSLFPPDAEKIKREHNANLQKTLEKRKTQTIAKPSGTKQQELTGRQEAIALNKAFDREHGLTD